MASKINNINAEDHLPLVKAVIKSLYIPKYLYEDCIAQGNYGLVLAVEKFDPDRGNNFSTYAWTAIRYNIIHYLVRERKIYESEQYFDEYSYSSYYNNCKDNVKEYFPFSLSKEEARLLNLYYFDRCTTTEIGQIYNTTGKYEMVKLKKLKERICRTNQTS